MEILIVEDSYDKFRVVKEIFECLDIPKITHVSRVCDAFSAIEDKKFDLIITDLGLPRFQDERALNPLEGLLMLFDLAYDEIFIPTIINSTTLIPQEKMEYLAELEYPILGHATDYNSLSKLIGEFILNNNPSKPGVKALARLNIEHKND